MSNESDGKFFGLTTVAVLRAAFVVLCLALDVAVAVTSPAVATSDEAQCRAMGLSVCPQPFDATLPAAADMLTWDQTSRAVGFRNTYRLYAGDAFHTLGAPVYPLPATPYRMPAVHYQLDGERLGLKDFLRRQSVTGLLILKNGHIAYEYYGSGNTDKTLWTSRSVAKSIVSVLIGMAVKEGAIGSVDDPIIRYLPELKGSAWDGVTLRELLTHTSGVAWNEHYADPGSDFARLTHCEAGPEPYACVLKLILSLQRVPGVKPGEVWSYNTAGAWLVGRVLEQATGMPIARFLETRLWSRYAMERDGVWQALRPGEVEMGGHGFNATLRDWGRFGLFVAGGGRLANGDALLPADWLQQSVTWTRARGSVIPAAPAGQYGYQWWYQNVDPSRVALDRPLTTPEHTFWAEGIYGQHIAINPTEHLVMIQWSTWKEAETPASLYDEIALFFDAVARSLHGRP